MSHSSYGKGSSKGSGSEGSRHLSDSSSGSMSRVEGVIMEMIPNVREDPTEELVEFDLP